MKLKSITLLVFVLLLFYCSNVNCKEYKYYQNKAISEAIRNEIKELNDKIFDGIESGQVDKVYSEIISERLRKNSNNSIESLLKQISSIYNKDGYVIKDEFYLPAIEESKTITIVSDESTNYEYKLELGVGNVDSYFSLIKFNKDAFLISLLYRKREAKWEIEFVGFNLYSIENQLPYDFFEKSVTNLKNGYILDAALYSSLSAKGLKPNKIFSYSKESEIVSHAILIDSIVKSKYIFPITIENIKTKPQIFQVVPQIVEEGIFPMINYLTKISMTDTVNLKLENDAIQERIQVIFPGITKNKKYIFYTAHDEIPTKQSLLKVYGFVQNLQ